MKDDMTEKKQRLEVSKEHYEDLKKSGLDTGVIEKLGMQDVPDYQIKLQGVWSAYRIPYFNLQGEQTEYERWRLFPPVTRNGHTQKYHQQAGTTPCLYMPPLCEWAGIARDTTLSVGITEGEKKAASACQRGLRTLGIAGVWNWRQAQSDGTKSLLEELKQFHWKGRRVVLVPDSDGWREEKIKDVLHGMFALGMELDQLGAQVEFVRFQDEQGEKVGLDDWFVRQGNEWESALETLERIPIRDSQLHSVRAWWNKWQGKPTNPVSPDLTDFHESDLGNAERFLVSHGENLRYCYVWNKWLVWDGMRWQEDKTGEVNRYATQTVRGLYREASLIEDSRGRTDQSKFALKCESEFRIRAIPKLACADQRIQILPDFLDADPWLFNVQNGTLNLKTGDLQSHHRGDLITKVSSVVYDAKAQCPTWEQFLKTILDGKLGLIHYLQRAMGYTLTGITSEQCLFLMFGVGANGKSTFMNTFQGLLGEYAKQASFNTFLVKTQDGISNDLARLMGARLVAAVEVESGKRFSEVVVKQLTGGDRITTRFLYKEHFEYTPQFKVFGAVNHKPVIKGTDHAIWRRIKLFPFTVTIAQKDQDRELSNKLIEELPGILNWTVQGCLEWQQEGLKEPKEVMEATKGYREEMDVFQDFLDQCCDVSKSDECTPSSDLNQAYQGWCKAHGEYPMSQRGFGLRLSEIGLHSIKTSGRKVWQGINLLEQPSTTHSW